MVELTSDGALPAPARGLARWVPRGRSEVRVAALVVAALAVGAALRLVLPGLIEFKGDEGFSFDTARDILDTGHWPALGMESSVGLRNPGLSVWIFAALQWMGGVATPVGLARAVACLNIAALLGLAAFAWTRRGPERDAWLWAVALAAVSPLGMIQQRKIWPPSVFPLLALAFYLAWRARDRRWAAFAWGALGVLMAQIHMGAVMYAAAFAAWAAYEAWRKDDRRRTRWGYWLAGSLLGLGPAVPWLMRLGQAELAHHAVEASQRWGNTWRMWMENAVGWNLEYTLGREHMAEFRRWPLVAGHETSLVTVALWAAMAVALVLAACALRNLAREGRGFLDRFAWDGAVAHNVAFFVYGLGMTLMPIIVWRHYLLVDFPFEALSLPLLARLGGVRLRWLGVVWAAHLVIALSLLAYLYAHEGAPGGDFGRAWMFQPP
ncbi:MAG: hypothetical protein U1F43_26510 [Myxococcota bacterium]